MKAIKSLVAITCALAVLAAVSVRAETCCEKAKAAGKTCEHACCVKAAKDGKLQLKEAYASVLGNEAWLINLHISQYSHGNRENHPPIRNRKLLLHRREIDKLEVETREKGLQLIPTKMYLKQGRIKCEIAVAKGKKLYDKRETDRKRTAESEARAEMRRRA